MDAVFDAYPEALKPRLMRFRQLIIETAEKTEGVGRLQDTLKWGQPSYLTPQTKSGTTIHIDQVKSATGQYGMFVHCQTSLISTYRELYPEIMSYDGRRAIMFEQDEKVPEDALRHCADLPSQQKA